jgi:predicted metal-dependent hydrolase
MNFKKQIVVETIVVDVVRKDIKNLHLRVRPPIGNVDVVAPYRVTDHTIRSFLMSKLDWIKKHQLKFEGRQNHLELEFICGENHLYQGRYYLLNVIYCDSRPKVEIRDNAYIDLYVKLGANQLQRQKIMTEWYRSELKKQLSSLIEKWKYFIGVEVDSWGIKKMKTKWGSCNQRDRRIWLNLELAKKPLHCLEFIIVHELTHLLERGHNDRFKALMDRFMPEWRYYKKELNRIIPPPTDSFY